MLPLKEVKKALLLVPPTGRYMRDPRCQAPVDTRVAESARPPMDLAYIASILEEDNIECIIKDYPMEKARWEDYKGDLLSFDPDMVAVSTTLPTLDRDLLGFEIAKQINRGIVTVAKGAHFSYLDKWPNGYEDIDIAVWDESPFVFRDLFRKDAKDITGSTIRCGEELVKNNGISLLDYIDDLPFPARHLLNNRFYLRPDTNEPMAFILTGIGCPYKCIFCNSQVVYRSGYKNRNVNSIIDEVELCIKDHGIKNFFFKSETFTLDKEWVISLCREISKRRLDIKWATNSRVDTIDSERLYWMKKAGCFIIGFGAESGSKEILEKLDKNITLDKTETAVSLCREFDIDSFLVFIIGFPWDRKDTIEETIYFATKKINPTFVEVNIAYPFPETPLFKLIKEQGLFNDDRMSGYDYSKSIIKTHTLSNEELEGYRTKFLKKFYLRPSYIVSTLKRAKSSAIFFNCAKRAFRLLAM